VTLEIRLIGNRYFDISQGETTGVSLVTPQVGIFCRQLLEQIRRLPGVDSAALIDWLPMLEEAERPGEGFTVAGRTASLAGEEPSALYSAVSSDYFRVMRIPLLRGRAITDQDVETSPWVVIINEAMAHKFWPNQDPIGQVIMVHTPTAPGEERPRQIVGVVGNGNMRSPESPVPRCILRYHSSRSIVRAGLQRPDFTKAWCYEQTLYRKV
jgi:hypothetical protein